MLTEQKDGMNRLRTVAQQWDQQTDSQLRRISEQQAVSSQALSEFDAESNKQMQMILNLVNSVQQTRENFKVSIQDSRDLILPDFSFASNYLLVRKYYLSNCRCF